jgi:hypothetical protein
MMMQVDYVVERKGAGAILFGTPIARPSTFFSPNGAQWNSLGQRPRKWWQRDQRKPQRGGIGMAPFQGFDRFVAL